MYQMIPLYVFKTKIYHFSTNFLQFELTSKLKPIDTQTDMRASLVRSTWQHDDGTGNGTWQHDAGPTYQITKKLKCILKMRVSSSSVHSGQASNSRRRITLPTAVGAAAPLPTAPPLLHHFPPPPPQRSSPTPPPHPTVLPYRIGSRPPRPRPVGVDASTSRSKRRLF
jgi:hypothetical protein